MFYEQINEHDKLMMMMMMMMTMVILLQLLVHTWSLQNRPTSCDI